MKNDDIQLKLAQESINMINMISERSKHGESDKWVNGMLTHHLPICVDRLKWVDDKSCLDPELSDYSLFVIADYILTMHEVGYDIQKLVADIKDSGLESRLRKELEGIEWPGHPEKN